LVLGAFWAVNSYQDECIQSEKFAVVSRIFQLLAVGRFARTVTSPGDDAYNSRLDLSWD
jgi:hypothetical protein